MENEAAQLAVLLVQEMPPKTSAGGGQATRTVTFAETLPGLRIVDYINDLLRIIVSLGPEAKTGVCVIALGYVLRFIPPFPNKWIPVAAFVLGAVLYPLLAHTGGMSPEIRNPIVEMIVTGFLIGVLAWVAHDKILSQLEDKIPFLKGLLARSSESKRYRKDKDGNMEEVKD